jgi:hypothetical protein
VTPRSSERIRNEKKNQERISSRYLYGRNVGQTKEIMKGKMEKKGHSLPKKRALEPSRIFPKQSF